MFGKCSLCWEISFPFSRRKLHCKPRVSHAKEASSPSPGGEIPKAIAHLSPAPAATKHILLSRVTILNRFLGKVYGKVWVSAVKLDRDREFRSAKYPLLTQVIFPQPSSRNQRSRRQIVKLSNFVSSFSYLSTASVPTRLVPSWARMEDIVFELRPVF